MSSFLQKLKGRGLVNHNGNSEAAGAPPGDSANGGQASHGAPEIPAGVTQLPVDVYQSDHEIIVYAQVAGVEFHQLNVSLEGSNDVVTIQGITKRPEDVGGMEPKEGEIVIHHGMPGAGEYALEECIWGQFYRQIILPEEVIPEKAEAKMKDGVLVLKMPLKGTENHKVKMKVIRLGGDGEATG